MKSWALTSSLFLLYLSRTLERPFNHRLVTVLYTGTVINSFLLTTGSYSVQLVCQTREANKQDKFPVMQFLAFHFFSYVVLSFPMCALIAMQRHNEISHWTCPQMPRPRANWDDTETKLLLDICLQEKKKFNFNQFDVTRNGWNNIYLYFSRY
jgi:hypothetical protein